MNTPEQEVEQLKAEVEYYKKIVTWYRDTYETRSTLGVLKEKLNSKFRNKIQFRRINSAVSLNKANNRQIGFIKEPSGLKPYNNLSFHSTQFTDNKLLKIGVFIHLYYQDLWPEINAYLQNAGINFDLFISLNEEDPNCNSTIQQIKGAYPKAVILKVANKGLDIGPFFELANYAIANNFQLDYFLKIHTKKSLGANAEVGEWWRKKCFESLMGSQSIVAHILRLFKSQPELGMIGPYETRMQVSMNDLNHGGNANANNIKILSERLAIHDTNLDFFGGTMFWAKWSIFEEKFKKNTMSINDFEPGYKKDELLSHAMERLLASIVREAGFCLYEMSKINDYIFYKNNKKKICWVHPGYGIGGGNRVIFDICQEQLKYFDVYSISYTGQPFTNWMDINHSALSFANQEEARNFIRTVGIDYVFATGWQTVDFVKGLDTVKKKFYFIQDYEPWFADSDVEKAKSTYNNTFNANIVISDWVKYKLLEEHNLDPTFIKCGITNYERYSRNLKADSKNYKPRKILFYFKLKNHYGRGADLIEALLKKLTKHKELELNVIGHEDPKIEGINFYGELHKEKLLNLYSQNDLFVDLSRHRGIATIALELAQFGVVPFLSHKEYGVVEYGFEDNKNCLFVESVDDAYSKILALSNDPKKFKELKQGIKNLSTTFNYKYTVNDFNQVVDVIS